MTPLRPLIRRRHPRDLPALTATLRAVHEQRGYPSVWPDDPAAFVTARGEAWVAVHGGQVAGQVVLTPLPEPAPAWAAPLTGPAPLLEVKRLFVHPDAQGRGLARALLDHALQRAQARGARAVLQVNGRSLPAVRLYERAGWTLAGCTRATWTDPDGTHPWVRVYVPPRPPEAGTWS
ncbi:GNAT family N-acetyltransferase [Deinococcus depolymerans]